MLTNSIQDPSSFFNSLNSTRLRINHQDITLDEFRAFINSSKIHSNPEGLIREFEILASLNGYPLIYNSLGESDLLI